MLLYVFTGTLDSVINANYAALNYPERFYAAASFSSELSLAILNMIPDDPRQKEFSQVFGDLGQLEGTQHDSMVWLQKAAEALYGLRQAGRLLSAQPDGL